MNAYLGFLESGEVYSSYPEAKGREFEIQVLALHRPTDEARAFFDRAGSAIKRAGFIFAYGPVSSVTTTMTANFSVNTDAPRAALRARTGSPVTFVR